MEVNNLLRAAYSGNIGEVLRLLDFETPNINAPGGDYASAVGAAAYQGHREIVLLLLNRGADVNSTAGKYGSALGAAAYQGHREIVSLLLDRRADVNGTAGNYGSALGAAAYNGHEDVLLLLIARGADVNAACVTGQYGTPLAAAALQGKTKVVSLLLSHGANPNIVSGYYGTALAAASYRGHRDIMSELLKHPGTDVNTIGGEYGTALGSTLAHPTSSTEMPATTNLLLDHGADINLVDGIYGSLLGKAAFRGDKELVWLLLARGADAFHVGGQYETVTGAYPTALDAARAGRAGEDIITLLSSNMNQGIQQEALDTKPWPPFPMPFSRPLAAVQVSRESPLASTVGMCHDCIEAIVNNQPHASLTPVQAALPCRVADEELLRRALIALLGIRKDTVERLQVWIRNDVHYLVNQGYDLGLAYAAARVAWKSFNDPHFNIAAHRAQWLARAKQIAELRENAIYMDDNGQELIKSPYSIMPRRVWDLKSNRVVEFHMLHSEVLAREYISRGVFMDVAQASPPFWAITHSWTRDMSSVETSINQYQWPTPLPQELDLEYSVRRELLHKGAAYVWLDVLCLRQPSLAIDRTQQSEWKLDVPTIGNVYRRAVGIARYFNGLGQAFSIDGWDDSRHWLRRAWTLQEIRSENTTYNAGIGHKTSAHIMMKTEGKVDGKVTTLRQALHPIVKLATQVDSLSGCSVYGLVREMAKRYSTQPTDKVAALFYLLRTTQLPIYDAGISDRDAWARCFHVLPFERKIEILFDFPYAGDRTHHGSQWFPTWRQLMAWPERDPTYKHTVAVCPQGAAQAQLPWSQKPKHMFVPDIWAISNVRLCQTEERDEYVIDVGDEIFGFYHPYVSQKPIEMSTCERYTLVTTCPDHSYNWLVCEPHRNRDIAYPTLDGVGATEIEPLKKLGVLRTDSCSELVLGMERKDSVLKKINALFF
ncbi:ankyrin repeat-containing domain protein [Tirmania nivea]|nr:ankyrin repeat-containing domain protein [Tirmania nivea]